MGICGTTKKFNYSKPKLNINNPETFYSNGEVGPFINPRTIDIEQKMNSYKDVAYIDILIRNFKNYSGLNCLGFREETVELNEKKEKVSKFANQFTFFSYDQVCRMSVDVSRNIKKLGLTRLQNFPGEGDFEFLGIFARNSCEWLITEIACQLNSITLVTLYNTLGEDAFAHICELTKFSTLAITKDCVKNLLEYHKKFKFPHLKNLILLDYTMKFDEDIKESLKVTNLNLFSFIDIVKKSDESISLIKSNPDTVLTLCFTSGTTGLPKGAKITQRNFGCQVDNVVDIGVNFNSQDRHLSYLPLAHIMEHLMDLAVLAFGGAVGFYSGDTKLLKDDLVALKSSFLLAVPRVLKIFRDKIFDSFDQKNGCQRAIIKGALESKKTNLEENESLSSPIYDGVVFSKVREIFNANWRFILTGSAPLPLELANEMKIIFGCPIIEGYGMTELTGVATVTQYSDVKNGHVGGPVTNSMIKIVDVPEMGYKNGNGELCVKGPIQFTGYFMDKENTSKIIDKDGWLHTGDVCTLLEKEKSFKIIDRVKEIFKLQQGEYIAPTKLEEVYSKSKYVSQMCIYGNSLYTFIIGIVVPNKSKVLEFLLQKGKVEKTEDLSVVKNFLKDKDLVDELISDFEKLAKVAKFNSLEKVKNLIISDIEFTIDNGLLTSTMKMVRKKIEVHFNSELSKIYTDAAK